MKLKRYIVFLIGLFINSLGVSIITKAELGTSPISSIPYVLSLKFPFSLGEFTIAFSILLIILQIMILRKNFKIEDLLQIPISIIFGYFIDFTMILLSSFNPELYIQKFIFLLFGCLVLGFGVYLELVANVAMLPGESFVRAVTSTLKTNFGSTKVAFDVSMSIIALILSFIFFKYVNGVREGTIVAAVLVGFIARIFERRLKKLELILFPYTENNNYDTDCPSAPIYPNIILIDRQYGSGGHDIGKGLAEKLGYSFYDNEIIQLAAGTTGYSTEYIQNIDEKMNSILLYDFKNQMYSHTSEYQSPNDKLFVAESKVINDLADKGNCVIVGRCADYILRNRKNCIKIFLHASSEYRINRIMKTNNITRNEAILKIKKEDSRRAGYYYYYTNRIWGMVNNYNITLDTGIGVESSENILLDLYNNTIKNVL